MARLAPRSPRGNSLVPTTFPARSGNARRPSGWTMSGATDDTAFSTSPGSVRGDIARPIDSPVRPRRGSLRRRRQLPGLGRTGRVGRTGPERRTRDRARSRGRRLVLGQRARCRSRRPLCVSPRRRRAARRPRVPGSGFRARQLVSSRRSHGLPLEAQRLAGHPGARSGDLRDPCRHLHERRNLGGGRRALAAPRSARRHGRGDDADRRFPRALRLGVRRRAVLCADRPLRHA